jgi:hypothetical protein
MKFNLFQRALGAAAVLGCASLAHAQFTISEVLYNPAASDDTAESVEIFGTPSTALTGWYLIFIEGDNSIAVGPPWSVQCGVVDAVTDLSTFSTGSNGLLLIRDSGTVILAPAPDLNTFVGVNNWTPDLENGCNTILLGFGTPPATTTDLDVDNDGTLDAPIAGFTVVDAVTYLDDAIDVAYADEFGGFVEPDLTLGPGALYRLYNANGTACSWAGGLTGGPVPGPFSWDVANSFGGLTGGTMDLGSINVMYDADFDGISDACDTAIPGFEAFCFGDGTLVDHTTGCPCGNNGAPGNGCGHSFDPNGANMAATGTPSLDDVVLHTSNEPVSSFTLMMQHANAGDSIFHDGVLCAANPLIRLRGRAAVAGEAFFPNSNFANDSTTTLSARGGTFPGSGATMRYAGWYRNASSTFCPPATANVTNGWVIVW